MENILTLGKLLSLWFCFLLHSILFLISQTSYRTYKIISSYELARPVMGTIVLVIGERAKRARHSQVCSIENRGYIYIFILFTTGSIVIFHNKSLTPLEIDNNKYADVSTVFLQSSSGQKRKEKENKTYIYCTCKFCSYNP